MRTPSGNFRTAHLTLRPLRADDADDVFGVFSNPETWRHLPGGRHLLRAQSEGVISKSVASWANFGLGDWAIIDDEGTFVGTGGASMLPGSVWNLGYRLTPTSWGRGFATEVAFAAVAAAAAQDTGRPMTARILSNNPASASVARRVGLSLAWEGATTAGAEPGVTGQIYSDRLLESQALNWLLAHV
ncbi:hypothetical protein GY21_02095 [Cryobacterium roopkundense]|uniref:RimJ/RimL family protein N-acetyltransferase n=1 Tax=Cryobacterium roopkundense TaxID=1001240 RepID=A0A099JT23_9MICO|nr:GNAT family N-acetyltransferase [Cryobacterium roopkundense]KGJ80787.1 hypothetical protein GY21_02095 [Cryobacterium roopkundense]MBB5639683.1 RimJ/RimL family protein N-acetyltransferase [Cryobacterium roopkundense]